jgi:hypothetical protein|uniref:hypothetical protein n=1 Tax=Nitrospira cf. moscoviensis SBR1015 TaxID=96242 RepID=UPI00117F146F|nr:hypothetical protein [Nitrospira cf. moscoviensis SBR1015]
MEEFVQRQHEFSYPAAYRHWGESSMINFWLFTVATMVAFLLGGCADGAKIVQEHDMGGVVIYPFKEGQGPMLSAFRKEGLDLMNEKCKGRSYSIVREGEAKGRTRVVSPLDGAQEVVEERRWGIQFECQ